MGHFIGDFESIQSKDVGLFLANAFARPCRYIEPDFFWIGFGGIEENRSAIGKAAQSVAQIQGVDIVERNEFDVFQFAMGENL